MTVSAFVMGAAITGLLYALQLPITRSLFDNAARRSAQFLCWMILVAALSAFVYAYAKNSRRRRT
jgi:hypothetical protein